MLRSITAALILAAIPAATLAAQTEVPDELQKPVTKSEISAKLDSDYSDLDANKDGTVTPAEAKAPGSSKKPTFKSTPAVTR